MSHLHDYDNNSSHIAFFLGAGASVDAGLFDVVRLVDKLKQWLESKSLIEHRYIIDGILSYLRRFKHEIEDESDVDIELLLETVEKIENRRYDVLKYFYENNSLNIEKHEGYNSVFNNATKLSTEIRCFIKYTFSNTQISTEYLNPLKGFFEDYGSLCIFSTNYDICVENFCNYNRMYWIDGFNPYWNPQLEFGRKDGDVRLYKLHGSITWYRSETGDYVRSDIITGNDTARSLADQPLVPLILYPGRKLQYIEPIIYLLQELERQIKNVKYIFVIGYSFKDDHIARLFRYEARKNRELIMFLISPSASIIYNNKLKYHQDEEFLKSFTQRSFTTKSFTTRKPSDLSRRVICLNYQFAKIFPFLKDEYLKHLIEDGELKNKANYKGSEEQITSWKGMLRHYMDCEYMDKVEEGINQIGLDRLISDDWKFSFEICFKGLLNSLISNDDEIKHNWSRYFEEVAKVFSIDQFTFQPSPGGPFASFLPHIKLELHSPYANISAYDLAEYLQEKILPIILQKLKIVPDKKYYKINEFLDRINSLNNYLRSWRGDVMTFEMYYRKRSEHYLNKMGDLRNRVNQFLNFQRDEAGQQHVRDLIKTIETLELLKIYGADTLKGDFSFTRLIGYLSTHN